MVVPKGSGITVVLLSLKVVVLTPQLPTAKLKKEPILLVLPSVPVIFTQLLSKGKLALTFPVNSTFIVLYSRYFHSSL